MKRIVSICLVLLGSAGIIQAQELTESLNGIRKVHIEGNSAIKIEAGTANELVLSYKNKSCDDCGENNYHYEFHDNSNDHRKTREEKAKGLKALYANGEDNTGLGMYLQRDGDVLKLRDLKPITQRRNFIVRLPKSMDLRIDTGNLGSVSIEGFSSEIEVYSNIGSIRLNNVTGPITANTSTGNIDVVFTSLNQNAPVSLNSSTGDVDVSIPVNTNANIELNSTMGNVYSNFEIERPREDGLKVVGARRKIRGKLNDGGVKLYLSSSTGNIYLRKQ